MKCVIIEDEKPAQRLLHAYISKIDQLELLDTFDSAIESNVQTIEQADILFLDIKLPELSGLSYLQTLPTQPEVVITTAFPDYAIEAFELEIADYLLKPFSFERFMKAVCRAEYIQQLKNQNSVNTDRKYFFIYTNKAFHRIDIEDILYIKSDGDYIHIVTSDNKWMLKDTLKSRQAKLPMDTFMKVHQSYIVNFSKIKKMEGNRIFVENKHEMPVSRAHKKKLLDLLSD